MLKRRNFLKTTCAAALGSLLIPKQISAAFLKSQHPVGLQLFTLFNVMYKYVKENLEKVAALATKKLNLLSARKAVFMV